MEENKVINEEKESQIVDSDIDTISDEEISLVANANESTPDSDMLERASDEASKDMDDEEEMDPEILKLINDDSVEEVNFESSSPEEREKLAKEAAMNMFDLSDTEVVEFMKIISQYKNNKEMNVYKELPDAVKQKIKMLAGTNVKPNQLNQFSKLILDEFCTELEMDQEYNDLMSSIEKEFNIPSIVDMYSEHVRETMEDNLISIADKIESEDPEKAKALREVSKAFTESYTYDSLIDSYDYSRQIRKALKHPESLKRCCDNFDFITKGKSKFTLQNPINAFNTLRNVFLFDDNITEEDIAKFIILFCKTCEYRINVRGLADIAYMYYFVRNITSIDFSSENKTEFTNTIISNVVKVIDFIKAHSSN